MKKAIVDFFSIDEQRVSTLIVSLMSTLVFALVMYYIRGDISSNLTDLLIWLILSVAGINSLQKVQSILKARNK